MTGRMKTRTLLLSAILLVAAPCPAAADPAPFDLAGPTLRATVTRGGRTLPIAEVPNLAEGDRLRIRADLPRDQSAHYLLIAAFLRGATNPPPESWFSRAETWTRKGKAGLDLIIPAGAQQVLLFLAPETGGDFATLRGAVRGRPGAFVRASQGLNQATLDRSRLDTFLATLRAADAADPNAIAKLAPQLAHALAVRLNPECLDKMPDLQAACLMQNQDTLLLNDGHSSALTETLTGPGADLALQLSATPQAGLGYYSPYIAAIRDIIGILGSLRTARYQYLPALGVMRGDGMALLLNAAPSFVNPRSVLVTALPSVAPTVPPPLHLANPDAPVCASAHPLTLALSGAPLLFSTAFAHDLTLEIRGADGAVTALPAHADIAANGLVVTGSATPPATATSARLRGQWGFDRFDGPAVTMQTVRTGQWQLDEHDRRALIVGRVNPVTLTGGAASCVIDVALRLPSGDTRPVEWKAGGPDRLALTVPLAEVAAGNVALLIRHAGTPAPETVPVIAYAEPSHIAGFTLHAGDRSGVLRGTRLDQVESVTVGAARFVPGALSRGDQGDALDLTTTDEVPAPPAGQPLSARLAFRDGRTLSLRIPLAAPRPTATIVARSVVAPPDAAPVTIALTRADTVARGAVLTFALRLQPGPWRGDEVIEVAAAQGNGPARLTVGQGLALQDRQTAIATLDTARAFDASTFGALQVRVVQRGVASDWQPLATLVRTPALHRLTCTATPDTACQLSGDGLYLLQAVAADEAFAHGIGVPDGYTGTTLAVPHPIDGRLFVRLRDDPSAIHQIKGASGQAIAPS